MLLIMSKVESYTGYSQPEKVRVNDKLDMYIYEPVDDTKDYLIGLVRNFEFKINEPFLMHGDTLRLVCEKLYERGLG